MPPYTKDTNYIDEYWKLYLQNEKLLNRLTKESEDRNDLLDKILKIECFYNDNLDKLQSERYSSGRKKHNRRCA